MKFDKQNLFDRIALLAPAEDNKIEEIKIHFRNGDLQTFKSARLVAGMLQGVTDDDYNAFYLADEIVGFEVELPAHHKAYAGIKPSTATGIIKPDMEWLLSWLRERRKS